MKIREFLYKTEKDTYIGINSKDHEEVFAFGNKRSLKLAPYFEREILNISLGVTQLLDEDDKECNVPFIQILIQHKDSLTVKEAVDKVIRKTFGDIKNISDEQKNSEKYKVLNDIRTKEYSIYKLLDLRQQCIDFMRIDWSSVNYERLIVYSEVLLELEAISFH